ncbi:MAG TPA: hypothetical protein VFL76_01130 [Edaphocola sp.]|nr:hypothetical protein [Edaphocola sp.]
MMNRRIIIVILFFILAGAGTGIYLWNMPHTKVENVSGLSISVAELSGSFDRDETAANARFLNKAITVSGHVSEVLHNLDGGLMAVLTADSATNAIECAFRDKNIQVRKGTNITVKGFCAGKTITGISLTSCVVLP